MEPPKPNQPHDLPWPTSPSPAYSHHGQTRSEPPHRHHNNGGSSNQQRSDHNAASSRLRASPYFKMRASVRELRPLFIQVLRTPDLRSSQPAQEIREKLRHLMDLYQQMTTDTASTERYTSISGRQHLQRQFQSTRYTLNVENQTAEAPSYSDQAAANRQPVFVNARGTFLVGGSAFGWNFITYPGEKPVYYGLTKESFRTARSKLQK